MKRKPSIEHPIYTIYLGIGHVVNGAESGSIKQGYTWGHWACGVNSSGGMLTWKKPRRCCRECMNILEIARKAKAQGAEVRR